MAKKINRIFALLTSFVMLFAMLTVAVSGASGYKTWLQTDSRWGSKILGTSGSTMSRIGCAVTSLAIEAVHSGSANESSFDPGVLVDYLSSNGGFDSSGNIYWGAVSGLVKNFTFEKRTSFTSKTKAGIKNEIISYINQGYYIVMSVKNQGHWVAVDTVKNGTVYMMDPAQNSNTDLFDYYSYTGMSQVRLFKGKNTPAKVTDVTYYTGHYKTTANLNLRQSYSTSYPVLTTIPKGKTVSVHQVYGNEWGQVDYGDYTGWISLEYADYIESSYSYKTGNYKCTEKAGAYIRSGIGSNNKSIKLLTYGSTVNVTSVKYGWGKVSVNGTEGWICMDYLTYQPAEATTTKVTTTSKTTTSTTTTTTKVTTTTTTTTTTVTTKLPVVKGDIDRNGSLTDNDVLVLNRYLYAPYELTATERFIMDVNGDGYIDQLDLKYLIKKIRYGIN